MAPGLEILSINGVSTSEYIKSNLKRYPSDGRILSRKYQNLSKNFSIDLSKFHYTDENFNLEVGSNQGIMIVTVEGISYGDFQEKTSQPKLEEMELELLDSISTAIITIRTQNLSRLSMISLKIRFLKSNFIILEISL